MMMTRSCQLLGTLLSECQSPLEKIILIYYVSQEDEEKSRL